MIPMLSVHYPQRYSSVFDPLIDFKVVKPEEDMSTTKPIWLDCSEHASWLDTYPSKLKGIDTVILPTDTDSKLNIQLSLEYKTKLRLNGYEGELASLLQGLMPEYHVFKSAGLRVIVPYSHQRRTYLPYYRPTSEIVLRTLKSLDELRCYPHYALITDAPIVAAKYGVDLSMRERTLVQTIPDLSNLTLTDSQLELAVLNIQHIREAQSFHE